MSIARQDRERPRSVRTLMSIARDGSLPIKVLKDLNLLSPCDSIDMQVFLGGVSILPLVSPNPPIQIR